MNVNEEDFQKRLDEIGKLYEDGKYAIYSVVDLGDPTTSSDSRKALDCLRCLRDIAAVAVKQAYQQRKLTVNIRYWSYLAVITAYVTFGVIKGFNDIGYYWIWLVVLIGVAEYFTRRSIKKRNK